MLSPIWVSQEPQANLKACTFMASRIGFVECANPLDEALHSPLLKYAHQGRTQSLAGIRRHFGHSRLGPRVLLDIASCHLPELQVSCNIGGNEDVRQFARGHQELGDKVDVPVVDAAVLLPWFLPLVIVAVLFEELVAVRKSSQTAQGVQTASILTEAASLCLVSKA